MLDIWKLAEDQGRERGIAIGLEQASCNIMQWLLDRGMSQREAAEVVGLAN